MTADIAAIEAWCHDVWTNAAPDRPWTALDAAAAECDGDTIIARTPRRTTPTRPPARLVADELGYVDGRWEPGEGS